MSSKRPPIDLAALTTEHATALPEAEQRRAAPPAQLPEPKAKPRAKLRSVPTADLKPLAFKVAPAFRKRFRERAVAADLKLNELLFAALDAWEEKQGLRR